MEIIWFLIIGGIAGWLAGTVMKGRGFGILGNIAVGIVGAIIGGVLVRLLGFFPDGGLLPALITAFLGSVVLLAAVSAIKKA